MKKYLLIFLLIPSIAHAATFVSVEEHLYQWSYQFNVKTNSLSISTPVKVTEYDCIAERNFVGSKQPIMPFPECFNTEAEARAEAQKKADFFEQNLIRNGSSSTVIEAKRQLMLLGK